jgi:uroporphyrinogen decarboxylase
MNREGSISRRETIRAIVGRRPAPRCGFWLGNPHPDTWPLLHAYFGTKSEAELRRKLGDDYAWISPQLFESTFRPLAHQGFLAIWKTRKTLGEAGPLAGAERPEDVEAIDWPDPAELELSDTLEALREAGDVYRASGFWCPFFHDVSDLFGMENYLVKMVTRPEIVRAATERVCDFYLKANERFYDRAGTLVDGFFFGNDFGSQLDLMLSPAHFDEFVLPCLKRLVDQAKGRGYQVLLHSCGSIRRVIGRLIEAGVDGLHPLQALARGMDAETLAREFKGRIAFLGGIDTQELLVHGTPAEVRAEVRRVKSLLGPHLVVSPSHEALLPNISPANVAALSEESLVY